jgi:V8-like Glu-specific endopeptidase
MKKLAVLGSTVFALAALGFGQSTVTHAQFAPASNRYVLNASAAMATDAATYWTAERMANAKALPLPQAANFAANADSQPQRSGTPQSRDGRAPSVSNVVAPTRLFDPADYPAADLDSDEVEPDNVGTFGAHFSSSRLIPLSADRQYPFKTVGKLFFTIPGQGDFVCSASVISFRILATAGHCVHSGNGSSTGWFTNWRFVPAFRDGVAPFLVWNWNTVVVTPDWFNGGGGVPNAADYAMIAVSDQLFGSSVRKIGAVTGTLGWQTLSLSANHTTKLGYPCNLDSCQKMHQVASGNFRNTSPNNVEYGSDARGGSSGGPWVQNFGALAAGQVGGLNPGVNRVVGVTSYGYVSTDPKVQGASILDSRWVSVWNTICGVTAGNCTP